VQNTRGDATQPQGTGPRVIVHVVNDRGGWGKGFVLALSRRYPAAEQACRQWAAGGTPDAPEFRLGAVQFVEVVPQLWVANVLAQQGFKSAENPVPLDYAALETGLRAVRVFAEQHSAAVHMPRIGSGLAGGSWERVARIVEECVQGTSVTVYDP
jgi:O-acetyl-ADP-ribose deacetylase (regulator of RNase III)